MLKEKHILRPNHTPSRHSWYLLIAGISLVWMTGSWFWNHSAESAWAKEKHTEEKKTSPIKAAPLFSNWPQQKPEFVFLLTGQVYGYLQKCGCSNPQKGGLERRYNFIESLKQQRGWEVLALDLGDISKITKLPKQALLKYQIAMEAYELMGYRSITLGREEFRFPLIDALASFTLQKEQAYPKVHAGNLADREKEFPSGDGKGSMVLSHDTWQSQNKVTVGIVSLIGKSTVEEIKKIDTSVKFAPNTVEVVKTSLAEIEKQFKRKADINILLYQGEVTDAQEVPKYFPEFQIIVCRSEESEPPATPLMVGQTMILRVGHKGQNVGVLGVFQEGGKRTFHYEKVVVSEEWETPAEKEADHPILKKLEWFSKEVKDRGYISQYPKTPHIMQVDLNDREGKEVKYVGSDACRTCHASAYITWTKAKHSHAYEALEKYAKKPTQRQFDGECIVCHTVGFEYVTGFDGSSAKMHLKDVGCEVCHGPGSMHVNNPYKKEYYKYLSSWKKDAKDQLPDLKKLEKLLTAKTTEEKNKIITAEQEAVLLRVDSLCHKCHDTDNDPHYNFEKYWPQIAHPTPK